MKYSNPTRLGKNLELNFPRTKKTPLLGFYFRDSHRLFYNTDAPPHITNEDTIE